MITTLATYQKEPFKIPNSLPAPNGADSTESIQELIESCEREILIDGLGVDLFSEVKEAMEPGADIPPFIRSLIHGDTYEVNGRKVRWEGLHDMLAYYVYYRFINGALDMLSTFGVEKPDSGNSQAVSAIPRSTHSYRQFHQRYQGQDEPPRITYTPFGVGVDYYRSQNSNRSLHQFLCDHDRDENFVFKDNINSMGI